MIFTYSVGTRAHGDTLSCSRGPTSGQLCLEFEKQFGGSGSGSGALWPPDP